MKLGILGSGKIVQEVLPVLNEVENIEPVAIAARNEEKLKRLSEEFAIEKYYVGIEELLADEQIDTVYVALPNNLHFDAMDKAIDAGKNIICEKPFTSNAYEAEIIIQKAKENNVLIVEAISHRFIPNAIEAKKIVNDLGDIKIVSFNYSQYSSRYDKFKEGIIEPVFSLESSGGALIDLNLYNVAFAVDTFGLPKDVKYFANIEKNIDTSGIVILDYEDFKVSCIGSKDSAAPMVNTIQGTKGTIEIPDALNSFEEFNLEEVGDDGQYSFQFNEKGRSRLYYEFVAIEEILRTRDEQRVNELLDKTYNYIEVLTKARFDANIYYPADKIR
ncbi:Gfo/Idh/MocA family protein [Anaerococcus sp. DFU013_CI05]|uniref:Gfo/Idh/MocA family protein n=1 Tax=Anaerococcus sp. AH8042_DFU013_CI05 TaxID=3385202 RepID=UPI003A521117